ncbi:MAG: hypothetical protein KAX10_00795 [Candidatus Lokiarchaeota archaeon]|nr:hypothetical protein [Candidatus Lokiarchaeota archaeon]
MSLSNIGWLNGITASGVFIFSCLFGLFFIYKSRRLKLKLLLSLGFVYFFAGLVYSGDVLDFITILITGNNVDNTHGIIGLINWIWFPGAVVFAMYIGAELITPKKKWLIFSIYLALGIIFEVFFLLNPSGTVTYDNPTSPGEDLINDNLVFESIPSIIALIFLLSIILFLGVGFLHKSFQSTGIIRRKFLYLSLGSFVYAIGAVLDGLFSPGIILIFIRSAMIGSSWLFYYGLKG